MCQKNFIFISHVNWWIILGVFTGNGAPVWVVWYLLIIFLICLKVTRMVVHLVYKCLDHDVDRLIWGFSLIVSIFMVGFIEGRTESLQVPLMDKDIWTRSDVFEGSHF